MSENEEPKNGNSIGQSETSIDEKPLTENRALKGKNQLQTIISTVLNLRTENPPVFYGAIAVLVVLLLYSIMTPGGKDAETVKVMIGSTYIMDNPNGGKVLLTAAPTFSSADYTADDSVNVCLADPGAKAKLTERRLVNYIQYIRLEVLDGKCQGKKGWTSIVNIRQ